MLTQRLGASLVLGLVCTLPTSAQWAVDSASNQLLAAGPSDQAQPKTAAHPDGGFWASWLDGLASGYDVRVARLDVAGHVATPSTLVADRGFTSTQDYGLDVAANGDALLAFRDDRSGSTQVSVDRVTGQGTSAWGGVQVSTGSAFVAAPKVAGTADGGAVVAWTSDAQVRLQRLDATGSLVWGTGVVLAPTVGSYSVADLHADGDEVVISCVHVTGGFTAPKHIVAQRFDALGNALWGTAPLAVFDGGSLQFGNFPAFVMDDAGGAVFAWYSSSPALQCFVQRVEASGAELFAHNGVEVATAPGVVRVNPHVAFDASSNSVLVAWTEANATQSQSGIRAQRIDASGARAWGDSGLELVPVGASGADFGRALPDGSGGTLFVWEEAPSFNSDQVFGATVDSAGTTVRPRFDVASTPSGKGRYASSAGAAGFGLLAWSDERTDGGDVYIQALGRDGMVGGPAAIASSLCDGAPNSAGSGARLVAVGTDLASANELTLWSAALPTGSFGFFLTSDTSASVANPGGSQGTLCLGGSIGRYVGPGQIQNSGAIGAFSLRLDLTQHPQPTGFVQAAAGETWYFQAWYRDANPAPTSNFSAAVGVLLR